VHRNTACRLTLDDDRVPRCCARIELNASFRCVSASTGWLQLDSKIVPFVQTRHQRLLSVDYLVKEHLIGSFDDVSLRSSFVSIELDHIELFNRSIRQIMSGTRHLILTKHSPIISLDEFLFRSKRLFFIRFLSSIRHVDRIDHHQVMSLNGGLVTLNTTQQRLPFIYIDRVKYVPQIDSCPSLSITRTSSMANPYELEYLRLIAFYCHMISFDDDESFHRRWSTSELILMPIDSQYNEHCLTTISLNDFHYHEYQRRTQQEKRQTRAEMSSTLSNGCWQTPLSTKQKRTRQHFQLQRPIWF
jgi:hypothetical protein